MRKRVHGGMNLRATMAERGKLTGGRVERTAYEVEKKRNRRSVCWEFIGFINWLGYLVFTYSSRKFVVIECLRGSCGKAFFFPAPGPA